MITLEVNGARYIGFTKISFTIDFKDAAGAFSFEGSLRSTGVAPLKCGDSCKIYVHETVVLTGYIEKLKVEYQADSKTISLSGRSRTADLIDSSLPVAIEFKGGVTLEQVARKVLDTIGLTDMQVSANTTIAPFSTDDLTSAAIGDKAFDFLEKYCRKRQVLAVTDGNGNLVLARASTQQINSQLINRLGGRGAQGNILSATMQQDNTKRFNRYVAFSQSNNSADPNAYNSTFGLVDSGTNSSTNIQGTTIDSEIRATRIHAFIAETSSDFNTLTDRAIWEANIRRVESFTYTVKVQGFTANADGFVWQPNMLINVIDEDCDIEAPLLIKKVTFNVSDTEGQTTTLELVSADAFTVESERAPKKKRKNKQGDKYNTDALFGL